MTKDSSEQLPLDPANGRPLTTPEQPGYYPGYSTLNQRGFWDVATRSVVMDRVENVPPLRFFTREEARLLEAVVDRILPQDDRTPERRIPIVNHIDERQYAGITDGYRFEDMPPDSEAMKLGLQAIEEMAYHSYKCGFLDLAASQQERLLRSIHDCDPDGAPAIWKRLPCERYWLLLVQLVVEAYYAHPWAWDEIGFGGPAYPRGYMRLDQGLPEPWEVDECRYDWDPPTGSVSGVYEPVGGNKTPHPPAGQSGSH